MVSERPPFQVELDIVSGKTLAFEMTEEWVLERARTLGLGAGPELDREKIAALAYRILLATFARADMDRPYAVSLPDWTWVIPTRNIVAVRFRDPLVEPADSKAIGFGPPDSR